jgi:hypothetical protein
MDNACGHLFTEQSPSVSPKVPKKKKAPAKALAKKSTKRRTGGLVTDGVQVAMDTRATTLDGATV